MKHDGPRKVATSRYGGSATKRKLDEATAAMAEIEAATGVSDPHAIIAKYATQTETLESLRELKTAAEKKLLTLTERRQNVKDDLERMKIEGKEAMTRKQVEDMERELALAKSQHEKAEANFERYRKKLLDTQAGIEHLHGRLCEIRVVTKDDDYEDIPYVNQDNLVPALELSRKKLKVLQRELKAAEPMLLREAMDQVRGGGLGGNQATLFKSGPEGNYFTAPPGSKKPAAPATGFGFTGGQGTDRFTNGTPSQAPGPPQVSQNVRIRLPDADNDDEASDDVDPAIRAAEDDLERMRIK